jgi:hypothetical protein
VRCVYLDYAPHPVLQPLTTRAINTRFQRNSIARILVLNIFDMRSTITALFSLAAVASSVVVPPRADYGFWDFNGVVTYPVSGYNSIIIDASYHNTELANPVNVHCEWHYHQRDQSESAFCTDPSFTYDVSSIGISFPPTHLSMRLFLHDGN